MAKFIGGEPKTPRTCHLCGGLSYHVASVFTGPDPATDTWGTRNTRKQDICFDCAEAIAQVAAGIVPFRAQFSFMNPEPYPEAHVVPPLVRAHIWIGEDYNRARLTADHRIDLVLVGPDGHPIPVALEDPVDPALPGIASRDRLAELDGYLTQEPEQGR